MRVMGKPGNSKLKVGDTTTIAPCIEVAPSQKVIQVPGNAEQILRKKKSCTSLLCELTRLKSQQKYLECNQAKLNASHYEDPLITGRNKHNTTSQTINEIEALKVHLEDSLKSYRENCYHEVQQLREVVSSIHEDVQPQRLSQCSLPELRERIISINTRLMQLCDKNEKEMQKLRDEYKKIGRDEQVFVAV